jgi:hypothetical protein
MDIHEFEAETLRRARGGDAAARREALAMATDATRRGLPLSAGLRAFLADALAVLQAVVEPGSDARDDLAAALAPLGFEANPPHRPPAADDELLRRLEIAAAVHVLAALPGMGKTAAVSAVALALPASEWTVWQACQGVEFRADQATLRRMAEPMRARLRELAEREPLNVPEEVRAWITEAKQPTSPQ